MTNWHSNVALATTGYKKLLQRYPGKIESERHHPRMTAQCETAKICQSKRTPRVNYKELYYILLQ
jgi:hypothetical protein